MGLAQNFAAIRALATEGIQKGHMALHARNVAAAAGVPTELVAEVARYMVQQNKVRPCLVTSHLLTAVASFTSDGGSYRFIATQRRNISDPKVWELLQPVLRTQKQACRPE